MCLNSGYDLFYLAAGVLSEGMLLCAEDENGELSLMVPEKKMPSGAEIC